jgi:hypothetical protein
MFPALHRIPTPMTCAFVFGIVVCALLLAQPVSAAELGAADRSPVVDEAATPAGWLPVDFGNAQISVPSSWSLITGGAESCGPSTGVVVLGQGTWCPPGLGAFATSGTSIVTLSTIQSQPTDHGQPYVLINGIPIYAPGVAPVYLAPSLGARLTFTGPQQLRVLHTLTASPRAVVLARGKTSRIPPSWRWISFSGIRFAVPATWKLTHSAHAPPCGTDIVLPVAGVTLARGPALRVPCPLPEADVRPVLQVGGIEVDGYKATTPEPSACVGPRTIASLHVCINPAPAYGVVVAQVSATGIAAITVRIGMAGNGVVERSVLYSLRRS